MDDHVVEFRLHVEPFKDEHDDEESDTDDEDSELLFKSSLNEWHEDVGDDEFVADTMLFTAGFLFKSYAYSGVRWLGRFSGDLSESM